MTPRIRARNVFGAQLRLYREKVGLTQAEFANLHKTDKSFITKVENGKVAIGIDLMDAYAASFGIAYYEMGNPHFRIPPLRRMPAALHEYLAAIKAERKSRKLAPGLKITLYLDPVIDSDFLQTPQTARMIADEIKQRFNVTIPPGRITAELTRAPRNEKVKRVSQALDGTAARNWYQLVEKA